jgi:hypothetical protein
MITIDGVPFALLPLRAEQPLTAAQSELYAILGGEAFAFEELELSRQLALRSPLALRSRLRYLKAKGYLLPMRMVPCLCLADPSCGICGGHGLYARFMEDVINESQSQTPFGPDRAPEGAL